jgi:hypothetical protein
MPHGLTTAPADPAPQWPSGYIEALREAGAQEKTIPLCIRWVRGFFAEHPGRRRLPVRACLRRTSTRHRQGRTQTGRNLGRTETEAFLRKMAARLNVTNWQVHPTSPRDYDAARSAFA